MSNACQLCPGKAETVPLLTIQSGLLHGLSSIVVLSNVFFPVFTTHFFMWNYFACSPACFMFSVHNFLMHSPSWKLCLYTDWAIPITLQGICKPRRPLPIIVLVKVALRLLADLWCSAKKISYVIWEQFLFSHLDDEIVAKTGHAQTFLTICNFYP